MANMDNNTSGHDNGYTLGEWQVFPKTGILAKGGHHTHAEPKVMQVLECLIMANGKMVTREELINRVWPRVVVNEEVLTRAISELRTLLGDVSRERRYINTIPKRGYRLIMPATPLTDLPGARPCQSPVDSRYTGTASVPVRAGKPGLFAVLFGPVRRLLDKPATAYVAVPMLALSLWLHTAHLSHEANGNATKPDVAHNTVSASPFPGRRPGLNPALSTALQSELMQLQVSGSLPESSEHVSGLPGQSVLVLPLAVITDDEVTHAFAAGLTQDLQHALFQLTGLQVVQQLHAQPMKTELILSGAVRIYDQLARVNLQVVEAQTSSVLWSSSFECVLDAPLQLQASIARQAREKLQQSINTYI